MLNLLLTLVLVGLFASITLGFWFFRNRNFSRSGFSGTIPLSGSGAWIKDNRGVLLTSILLLGVFIWIPSWIKWSAWFWGSIFFFGATSIALAFGDKWRPAPLKAVGILLFIVAIIRTFPGPVATLNAGTENVNAWFTQKTECIKTGNCVTDYYEGDRVKGLRPNSPLQVRLHPAKVGHKAGIKVSIPPGYFAYTATKTQLVKDLGHTAWFAPCGADPVTTEIYLVPLGTRIENGGSC